MATSAATVAAAAAARARREVRAHFEEANAFDSASAVAYVPPGHVHRAQFDSLVGRGIVNETVDGRYWFDRDAERADEERRRAAALLVLKIVLIVFAIGIAAGAIISAVR
jgi:hypothetical protein